MALTATLLQRLPGIGAEDLRVIKVTGDSSYPTGGYAVTPALFGFNAFATDVLGTGKPPVAGYYSIVGNGVGAVFPGINPTQGNLQLYVTTTGLEVAAAVDESTAVAFLAAFGH
jgi:hypothetical protein